MVFNDLKFFIPELFFIGSFCLLLTVFVFSVNSSIKGLSYRSIWDMGFVLTVLALGLYLCLLFNQVSYFYVLFYGSVDSDFLVVISKVTVVISVLILLPFAFSYFKSESFYQYEFFLLLLLSLFGLIILFSSSNFLVMYLGLELQSLAAYVLVSIRRNSVLSIEAGLRYFVLGSLASGLVLFGIALLYGLTGSIFFSDFYLLLYGLSVSTDIPFGVQVSSIFILSGLLFKLSAAPFHFWVPDVYEGASTPVAAFIAVVPKVAIVSLLVRFQNFFFFVLADHWFSLLLLVSMLSLFVGMLGGLYQSKIRRLLAYSTITHVGFITLAFAINADFAAIYYVVIYAIVNIALFGLLMILRRVWGNEEFTNIHQLSPLSHSSPLLAYAFVVFFFSLAGLPPFAGFFAKYYVVLQAVGSDYYLISFLAIFISTVGAFYYLRVVRILFFESSLRWIHLQPIPTYNRLILAFFLFINVFFYFFASYLFKLVKICTL